MEGLFVDSVDTGKKVTGMSDYIHTNKLKHGSTVVFWYTNGATT